MGERKTVTIEDCTDVLGDGLHGTPKYTDNGEYAFVNGNNLINGKIVIKSDTKRVNYEEFEKYKKPLNDRTVFVSINGTLGNVGTYNGEKVILGKSACYFNVKNDIDKDFIYYVVSSAEFKQHMERNATGTTIKNFSLKQMREYSFEIPEDIQEQRKISGILKQIDLKIQTNNEINSNLEQQAYSIYQAMFSSDNQPNGVLIDIADITMGQSPSGDSLNEENGTVFYQGRTDFTFRFPSVRLFTTEPKRMALKNDVLLSVRAPVGDINVALDDCCIGRGLAAIHSKDNKQSFVYYTVKALYSAFDMFNGEGTVFGSINKIALNSMPIYIPDIDEIDKFEHLVSPMDRLILENHQENIRLQGIRDSLLPKLMSGEIDLSSVSI